METTWKQAVYDIADAYREAEGTEDKISIANLKEKVRDGGGKVYLDGERIKQLEMTSYKGDNPLTIGASGAIFDANVLLQNGLTIVNGVNGEDLTDVEARQALAVADLMRMAKRKVSEARNFGEYVWKKYIDLSFTQLAKGDPATIKVTSKAVDLTTVNASYFVGLTINAPANARFEITSATTYDYYRLDIGSSASGKTWSYNPSTQVMTFNETGTVDVFTNYEDVVLDLSYAVADEQTVYPDGAEQDGYWYERYVERLTPEMFGCTKMAVDTFSFSADKYTSSGLAITHSLDDIPKFVFIIGNSTKYNMITRAVGVFNEGNASYFSGLSMASNGKTDCMGNNPTMVATKSTITITSQKQIQASIEHTLITMA